jgi:Putative peptidoglycan binding domain
MASNTSKGLDTGTKVVIGFAALALILFVANGSPDNDAWQSDERDAGATAATLDDANSVDLDLDEGDEADVPSDDPWTSGAPSGSGGDDDETEPPVDDPWTRGAPSGSGDGGDDAAEPPVDDPWTRGSDTDGGFGDDGLPPCVGVSEFETDDGTVSLPIDRSDDAFASPDCEIAPGGSGNAVWLVQVALSACNGQPVPLDGVQGDATTQALAAVQAANGLTVDGVYGPATREAMAWPTAPDGAAGGAVQCIAHPDVE